MTRNQKHLIQIWKNISNFISSKFTSFVKQNKIQRDYFFSLGRGGTFFKKFLRIKNFCGL